MKNNELKELTVIEAINTVSNFNVSLTFQKYLNIDFVNESIKEIEEVLNDFYLLEYLAKTEINIDIQISQYDHFSVSIESNKKLEIYIPKSLKNNYLQNQDDILKVLSAIKIFIRSVYNQYISYKKFLESKLSDVIKWKYTILYLLKIASLSQQIQAS